MKIKENSMWFNKKKIYPDEHWVVKVLEVQENKVIFRVVQYNGKSLNQDEQVALEADTKTFLENYE